jgi:hypothetical protein
VAGEWDGPDTAMKTICPLQCWLRHGGAPDDRFGGQAALADRVDWAGLPINLDLAFSREQRDKVYAQHLVRKRGAQLRRWRGAAHVCVCDAAAERECLDSDAGQAHVERFSADLR